MFYHTIARFLNEEHGSAASKYAALLALVVMFSIIGVGVIGKITETTPANTGKKTRSISRTNRSTGNISKQLKRGVRIGGTLLEVK